MQILTSRHTVHFWHLLLYLLHLGTPGLRPRDSGTPTQREGVTRVPLYQAAALTSCLGGMSSRRTTPRPSRDRLGGRASGGPNGPGQHAASTRPAPRLRRGLTAALSGRRRGCVSGVHRVVVCYWAKRRPPSRGAGGLSAPAAEGGWRVVHQGGWGARCRPVKGALAARRAGAARSARSVATRARTRARRANP